MRPTAAAVSLAMLRPVGAKTMPRKCPPRRFLPRRLEVVFLIFAGVWTLNALFYVGFSIGEFVAEEIEALEPLEPIVLTAETTNEVFDMTFWGNNNRLCSAIAEDMAHRPRRGAKRAIHVNATFSCRNVYNNHRLGTGNWLWLLYAMRLAAAAHGNVDLRLKCKDDHDEIEKRLVLPWALGHHGPHAEAEQPIAPSDEILRLACAGHMKAQMWHMVPSLREDLGRMAEYLVGTPEWLRDPAESGTNATTNAPVYPDIELDETTWHFRCGDVVTAKHPGYAWHKFGRLAQHIRNDTRSIGIVTQPFEKGAGRERDFKTSKGREKGPACERLAGALVDYLRRRFPDARVSVRNSPDEPIALAYARMIAARQTVVGGVSTFGVFAALASRGQAILVAPDFPKAPGPWLLKWERNGGMAESHVTMVHDPRPLILPQSNWLWWTKEGGQEAMLEWLQDDDISVESEIIQSARDEYPMKDSTT
ncbi:hypothetical protein ACHAXT_010490 [Thalassiosira profunda]